MTISCWQNYGKWFPRSWWGYFVDVGTIWRKLICPDIFRVLFLVIKSWTMRSSWCAPHQTRKKPDRQTPSSLLTAPWFLPVMLGALSIAKDISFLQQSSPTMPCEMFLTVSKIHSPVCETFNELQVRLSFVYCFNHTLISRYELPWFVALSKATL